MTQSIENYYKKIEVLHSRAIELHRERFKTSGSYDKRKCEYLIDDIKYMARLIYEAPVDMETDFGK
tara:strand:+ start:2552 stop:2749 length:198 start_codon:yes stop_codon:yes gene_type:complete